MKVIVRYTFTLILSLFSVVGLHNTCCESVLFPTAHVILEFCERRSNLFIIRVLAPRVWGWRVAGSNLDRVEHIVFEIENLIQSPLVVGVKLATLSESNKHISYNSFNLRLIVYKLILRIIIVNVFTWHYKNNF